MNKVLNRNLSKHVIGGVCAGLADFLGIDAIIVRVFFLLWMIFGEMAFLIYMILWVVIPAEGSPEAGSTFKTEELGKRFEGVVDEIRRLLHAPSQELVNYAGITLIAWGVSLFVRQLGFRLFTWWNPALMWPLVLVVAGAFILYRAFSNRSK